jgi:glycosyltransferase involved in cell wall biosynthesis
MRIIFANKYFFLNGGTETYLRQVMNSLSERGHETIPFSVRYADTWSSPYLDYFLAPPGESNQAHLGSIRFSPSNLLRFLDRSTYSFEARIKLRALLKAVQGADIAYVLNIYNYMSPSIIHTFKRHRIPVVIQTGDYHLLCPSYSLLRNGRPCTLCVGGEYYHGLRHRCVKNHLPASVVRVAAMYLQRWIGLYHLVDAIVVPCRFMKDKLMEGGFCEEKIHLLPYPVENTIALDQARAKKNHILYFGRISFEKGIDTLLAAFQKLDPPVDLVIMGRSYDGEEERLKRLIQPHVRDRIHFTGFRSGQALSEWIAEALFSVVPSRWYDNAPLSIYESLLHETPVVAADIGGIPEQIEDGVTGRLFEPDSCDDLMQKMKWMLADPERRTRMGKAGRAYVTRSLRMNDHLDALTGLFERVIAERR